MSFINYFRIVTQANNFITAVNTNTLTIYSNILQLQQMNLHIFLTAYYPPRNNTQSMDPISCGTVHSTSPTSFASLLPSQDFYNRFTWENPPLNSTLVKGFYTGCSPFEALLKSTLDCLYDIECLELFHEYYPLINQVCFIIILHKSMKFYFLLDKY